MDIQVADTGQVTQAGRPAPGDSGWRLTLMPELPTLLHQSPGQAQPGSVSSRPFAWRSLDLNSLLGVPLPLSPFHPYKHTLTGSLIDQPADSPTDFYDFENPNFIVISSPLEDESLHFQAR